MKFEWDERKNRLNKVKHGFDFAVAEKFFAGTFFAWIDERKDYSEERFVAFGQVEKLLLSITYTIRPGAVYRIISLRRASRNERRAYRALQKGHEG